MNKGQHGFWGLKCCLTAFSSLLGDSPAASSALSDDTLSPQNSEGPANEQKWALARPQDEGGLTPTGDEYDASVHLGRWQAYCLLFINGRQNR